jgi:hypothetical protein
LAVNPRVILSILQLAVCGEGERETVRWLWQGLVNALVVLPMASSSSRATMFVVLDISAIPWRVAYGTE